MMANPTTSDETEVGPPTSPDAITARDLLFTTARVVRANVASFFLLAALCTLPSVLLSLAGRELEASAGGGHGWTGSVGGFLYLLGLYVAQASIVFATVEHLAGRAVAPHESLTAAYHRLVSVLVVAFVAHTASVLGLLLLVVPGVLIWVALFAAIPAVVIEGRGPIDAMKRSLELTKGHRGTIFLASLAIPAVLLVVACCLVFPCTAGLVLISPDDEPLASPAGYLAEQGINFLFRTFVLMGTATLIGVVYARARALHGRIDADAMEEVFR